MKPTTIIFNCILIFILGCNSSSDVQPNPNPTNPTNPTNTGINITGPNVRDIDGNIYTSVTNCSKTWMKQNLKVSRYRNGDQIPEVKSIDWWRLTSGAWCYYNNDPSTEAIYGKIYNWYAVNDPRGLAPEGWHVSSKAELNLLINCLGGKSTAGGDMKEVGFAHWLSPNTGATNRSGFTALGGLGRGSDGTFGSTILLGKSGSWWNSDNVGLNGYASYYFLDFNSAEIIEIPIQKSTGAYVRCIKN
jgi:uncharacterized protein (TIGR02145 family)